MRDRWLGITVAIAVLVLIGTSTAILVLDHRVTSAEALRTGGLAAGSVVALYALWLNDRRRRVEEQRQELEHRTQELDRERYALEQRRQELEDRRDAAERTRVANEHFARAVELLGSEAEQVRVGALHALAGLARDHHDYTQTVLDVLCSYLRQPFVHPQSTIRAGEDDDAAERTLTVRLTAQRLIADLLPSVEDTEAPAYDLDLTRARLDYLYLSGRRIGTLTMRYAHLYNSTNISHCELLGRAWFTGVTTETAKLSGIFRCQETVFHQRAWFDGASFHGPAFFDRAEFRGWARFRDCVFAEDASFQNARFLQDASFQDARFHDELDLRNVRFESHVDLRVGGPIPDVLLSDTTIDTSNAAPTAETKLPDGWSAEPVPDSDRARLRAGPRLE